MLEGSSISSELLATCCRWFCCLPEVEMNVTSGNVPDAETPARLLIDLIGDAPGGRVIRLSLGPVGFEVRVVESSAVELARSVSRTQRRSLRQHPLE